MKACVDCKFFSMEGAINSQPRCARFGKRVETHDIVFGTKTYLAAPDCRTAREANAQCGPQGRFWIDKRPNYMQQVQAPQPPLDPRRKKMRWAVWPF